MYGTPSPPPLRGPTAHMLGPKLRSHYVWVVLGVCLAPIRGYGDLNFSLVQPSPEFPPQHHLNQPLIGGRSLNNLNVMPHSLTCMGKVNSQWWLSKFDWPISTSWSMARGSHARGGVAYVSPQRDLGAWAPWYLQLSWATRIRGLRPNYRVHLPLREIVQPRGRVDGTHNPSTGLSCSGH